MTPLVKWTGGKRSEIPFIKPHYPDLTNVRRVVEPFSGGAAVSWDLNADATVLNDVNGSLVRFYRALQEPTLRSATVEALGAINTVRRRLASLVNEMDDATQVALFKAPESWAARAMIQATENVAHPFSLERLDALALKHLRSKVLTRLPAIEVKRGSVFTIEERWVHVETAVQSAWYEALREIYNQKVVVSEGWRIAAWWAVRTLCYSGMFRYSANGDFNVPYGGIGYNARDFSSSIAEFSDPARLDFLSRTTVESMDFEDLFKKYDYFGPNDFVFVDPPYDSAFSKYNHEGDFTRNDQERLRDALLRCNAPWMQVIKTTPFIEDLYTREGVFLHRFDKKYGVNFRNRHDRAVEHLVITNYPLNLDLAVKS